MRNLREGLRDRPAQRFSSRLVPVRSQPGKRLRLRQMIVDQLGHLEHGDLLLAAEDAFEFVVSIDITTVFAVLKIMALDVGPDLLGHLGTRHGIASDHRRKCGAGGHCLHESRIGLAFCA